jgi:hypothetical protein
MAKFTTLIPLPLLISCKHSFTIVDLKMSPLPTLALKSPNKFSYNIEEIFEIHVHALVPHRSCPSYHQFYPLLCHERSEQ